MKYILFLLISIAAAFPQQNNFFELEQRSSLIDTKPVLAAETPGFNSSPEKKNTALGILYSFLLPGMGELYAGDYSTGKYFTIAEGAFWGTYLGMSKYSDHMKDNYITYAKTNGGAVTENKDGDFFANIGNYRDIYQYNDEKAFQRNFEEMYDVTTHYWKWNTTSERKSYRNMWVTSQEVKNNLRFVVGAVLLNRVASAINAVRLIVRHNRGLKEPVNTSVLFDYTPSSQSINLNIYSNF